jgi:HD-like signal output (HDOD) protein
VRDDITKLHNLPPMPATASQLLAMAADADVDLGDLAATIERDPALTAKVLGVANSAYYSPRQPVVTVKHAIIQVLGLRMVCNLAFGIALNGAFSSAACPRFDPTAYWVTALGTAELASGLARAANVEDKPDPDVAYLAGLLHNLGELLLVHLRPTEMNRVLGEAIDQPERGVVSIEREHLGIDRWEAGALLARHWQLPAAVGDAIEAFGSDVAPGSKPPLVQLLAAAREWVEGVAVGRSEPLHVTGVDEAYCEYRASSFVEGFDSLKTLASNLHS